MASSAPLLSKSSSATSTDSDTTTASLCGGPHKPLAVLSGHSGSVSCLALCGEFLLSASRGRDIIVWQQPDLRQLARFGHGPSDTSSGSGFVKSLVAVGSRVFSAHQDSRIRVWKISSDPENPFKLFATLPTLKDYFGRCISQANYVQTRRNHRKLWIQHADSISCLAAHAGLIYSGSWDKTLKVWRMADLRCLESIKAHDDAVNALVAHKGLVYSASADGKIKVWGQNPGSSAHISHCLKDSLQGHKGVCWNAVIVCDKGRLVYGGGSDGRVMGWEREGEKGEEWRLACDVRAHEAAVLCLCSTAARAGVRGDGEFVCSGSADKSIAVWRREEEGGLCRVTVIRGHEAPVKCLQASEIGIGEGFMLYSGGLDQRLRVWWVPKKYEEKNEEGMKKCVLLR